MRWRTTATCDPHDGKNIGFWQLLQAVRSVYNLSFPLAALLALVGILLCGHAMRLDLDMLALHNRIEHDASLVHRDTPAGRPEAPISVDPELLASLLSHANEKHGLSLDAFAQLRVDRESRLSSPLGTLHSDIGTGEAALSWLLLKEEGGQVPVSALEQWYGEERMPDGWTPPAQGIGLLDARQTASHVASKMEEIRCR
ncbi:hypothetical protein JVU11DRAFT_8761 [Chiua virens]|nr:hypothetical protein JVU11DRAFT_8761 [Chiua virens]